MHVRVRNYLNISQDVVIEEKKLLERDHVVAVINNNYNDSTATTDDCEKQATVKCTSALPSLKQIKAREEERNTLISINSHQMHQQRLSCDALVKEIVSTKLGEMILSVEERDKNSKNRPSYPPSEQPTNKQVAPTTVLSTATQNSPLPLDVDKLLDTFLKLLHPRNYKRTITEKFTPWSSSGRKQVSASNWRTRRDLEQLTKYMQVVAGNDPDYCALLLNAFVNSNKCLQQKMKNKMSFNDEVMQSINKFVSSLSASGCRQKEEKEALRTIVTPCTYQLQTTNKIRFAKQ